jgi:hypothetical protein
MRVGIRRVLRFRGAGCVEILTTRNYVVYGRVWIGACRTAVVVNVYVGERRCYSEGSSFVVPHVNGLDVADVGY